MLFSPLTLEIHDCGFIDMIQTQVFQTTSTIYLKYSHLSSNKTAQMRLLSQIHIFPIRYTCYYVILPSSCGMECCMLSSPSMTFVRKCLARTSRILFASPHGVFVICLAINIV